MKMYSPQCPVPTLEKTDVSQLHYLTHVEETDISSVVNKISAHLTYILPITSEIEKKYMVCIPGYKFIIVLIFCTNT